MRIALLSNVTVELLAGMLKKEHQVWVPIGFGAWVQTAINPPEDLKEFGPESIYLLLDGKFGAYDDGMKAQAISSLSLAFPKASVIVPNIAALAEDFGDKFYDERMWKLGSMPWSLQGLKILKGIFGIKKVLALDFDNTLWDGVIGEDGAEGIKPKVAFQKQIKALKDRGVLLTALSKNNPEDVSLNGMPLERADFVGWGVNWDDKAVNLVKIAKDLNLGVDSFVFVDDNPVERAQMRALCPSVTVAEFPPNLDVYFPKRELTAEDLQKTAQYQAEAARKNLAEGLSVDEYLKELKIWTDIHPIAETEVPRVAQLSQKTNQFNVCTNRYTEDDIRRFAADPNRMIVTLHAGDKFGDQGLVAFVHVQGGEIVDWVMSCRAMNRRIEFAVQAKVEELLRGRGIVRLTARWRKTAKNAPVKDLFERFGFTLIHSTEEEKQYERVFV